MNKNIWGGAEIAPDQTLVVIGDVHGCTAALDALLEKIDLRDKTLVFVGDIVDRGEDSAGVLSKIFDLCMRAENPAICLMGNHERMMLDFLDDPVKSGERWLKFGGLQTVLSFGLSGVTDRSNDAEMISARDELRTALPKGIEGWMRGLSFQYTSGNVHVVHAAASPNHPMDEQSEEVLLWGHPHFLKNPRPDDEWVVHGHTVVAEPENKDGRISIDTGAYANGTLTAVVIESTGQVTFVQN